jgi:hypothetical protein
VCEVDVLCVLSTQVSLAYNILTKANNLLMGSDPILSGITFVLMIIIAVFISAMLCIFTPNQVFWFGGLSFFTPPELQDYIVDSMFQQMLKTQQAVLSLYTRNKNVQESQPEDNLEQAEEANETQSDVQTATASFGNVNRNLSTVSTTSTTSMTSTYMSPTPPLSGPITSSLQRQNTPLRRQASFGGARVVYMDEDEEETDFVEKETFRAMQLLSYKLLKTQTYKWLKMVRIRCLYCYVVIRDTLCDTIFTGAR